MNNSDDFFDNCFLDETEISQSFDKELFELVDKYRHKVCRFHIAKLLILDATREVLYYSEKDSYFQDLGILNHFLNHGARDKTCW